MIAAIVPAYNEEGTIGSVVRVLKAVATINEIIVVDDGSSDRTAEEAEAAGAHRVLRLSKNVGKSEALARGVAATGASLLFFCDADLLGLTTKHVERLLEPVVAERLHMCTGLRDRGPVLTKVIAHLPILSGERALRREVFEAVPRYFLKGFRVEVALNFACRARGWAYGSIPTLGVGQVHKMRKRGVLRGLAAYAAMIWDVAEAMVRVRFAKRDFLNSHAS